MAGKQGVKCPSIIYYGDGSEPNDQEYWGLFNNDELINGRPHYYIP